MKCLTETLTQKRKCK